MAATHRTRINACWRMATDAGVAGDGRQGRDRKAHEEAAERRMRTGTKHGHAAASWMSHGGEPATAHGVMNHLNNAGVNVSSRGSVRSTTSSSSPGGGRQLLRPWGLVISSIPFTSSPDTTAPPPAAPLLLSPGQDARPGGGAHRPCCHCTDVVEHSCCLSMPAGSGSHLPTCGDGCRIDKLRLQCQGALVSAWQWHACFV